jgi:hypothetical protein
MAVYSVLAIAFLMIFIEPSCVDDNLAIKVCS